MPADAQIHVRDSKDTTIAPLSASPAAWTAFIEHTSA
nr:DUF397 domain-containing protein [Streptomyces sp. HNM0574]